MEIHTLKSKYYKYVSIFKLMNVWIVKWISHNGKLVSSQLQCFDYNILYVDVLETLESVVL